MRGKSSRYYKAGGIFLGIFLVFTILVKVVDVAAIGPEGSSVGFSKINGAFFKMTGYNEGIYNVTDILGKATFLVIGIFALLGLYQLVITRSLKGVDKRIRALGLFYVAVGIVYVLFNVISINFRPVLEDGQLEASYPSSHTILACCVFLSAIIMINQMVPNRAAEIVLDIIAVLLLVALVAGRLLSGVHWLTDIIAGVIISIGLVLLFRGVIERQIETSSRLKLY